MPIIYIYSIHTYVIACVYIHMCTVYLIYIYTYYIYIHRERGRMEEREDCCDEIQYLKEGSSTSVTGSFRVLLALI